VTFHNHINKEYKIYIVGFCSTIRRKIKDVHSFKMFITQYDGNHSDFHPGMAVFVPFYSI